MNRLRFCTIKGFARIWAKYQISSNGQISLKIEFWQLQTSQNMGKKINFHTAWMIFAVGLGSKKINDFWPFLTPQSGFVRSQFQGLLEFGRNTKSHPMENFAKNRVLSTLKIPEHGKKNQFSHCCHDWCLLQEYLLHFRSLCLIS